MHWLPLVPLVALALLPLASQAASSAFGAGESLPVTLADGDLKVTIRGLATVPPPGGGDPEDPNENSWTRVGVKLDWGGRSTREWALANVQLTDARGTVYKPRRTSTHFTKDGEGEVRFSGPLWSTAEPWRVRLEFARTFPHPPYEPWKVFREDEILTVRGVPVPPPGQTLADGRTAEAHGAKVQLLGYAGANAQVPGGVPFKYAHPSIQYRVERPKDVHVTFLRATDASGKVLKLGAAALGYSAAGECFAREIQVPSGVREIYLAFAVHKSRVFEFTAHPSH